MLDVLLNAVQPEATPKEGLLGCQGTFQVALFAGHDNSL